MHYHSHVTFSAHPAYYWPSAGQSNAKTHGYQGKKKFGFEPHQVLENIFTDLKLAQTLLNLTFAQIYFIDALKLFFFTEAEIKILI